MEQESPFFLALQVLVRKEGFFLNKGSLHKDDKSVSEQKGKFVPNYQIRGL